MSIINRRQAGFTIVELLIVIVVIAILATISIVAYNGIQNRANASAVQSDMRNVGQKIMMFYATEGRYPLVADLQSLELRFSKGSYFENRSSLLYCAITTGGNAKFVIAGVSKQGNGAVYYSSTEGLVESNWTGGGSHVAICPQHGVDAEDSNYVSSWGHTSSVGWAGWAN